MAVSVTEWEKGCGHRMVYLVPPDRHSLGKKRREYADMGTSQKHDLEQEEAQYMSMLKQENNSWLICNIQ